LAFYRKYSRKTNFWAKTEGFCEEEQRFKGTEAYKDGGPRKGEYRISTTRCPVENKEY